jgi:hypothetical protein
MTLIKCLSVSLSAYLSVYLSVFLFVCLSVCLSECLHVYLVLNAPLKQASLSFLLEITNIHYTIHFLLKFRRRCVGECRTVTLSREHHHSVFIRTTYRDYSGNIINTEIEELFRSGLGLAVIDK